MNSPQGNTAEQVQAAYSTDYLQQIKEITADQKMIAFFEATAKKYEFQTAMLRIVDEAKATEWIDQLEEENREAKIGRQKEKESHAENWEKIQERFNITTDRRGRGTENLNTNNEQPANDQKESEPNQETPAEPEQKVA